MGERGVALFLRGGAAPAWLTRTLVLAYALIFLNGMQFSTMFALAPTFKDDLRLSKFETGLIFTASGLAAAAASIPLGLAADRIGARRVCLAGGLLVAACLVLQGLAPDLPSLLVARVGIGAGFAGVFGAGATWIGDSALPERRSSATAALMPVAAVGALVGPVVGGVLADSFGRAVPNLGMAVLSVLCVGWLLLSPAGGSAPHGHDPVLRTLARARSNPLIVIAFLLMLLGALTEAVTGVLGPLQLDHNGLSAGSIGGVQSIGSGLFIVIGIFTVRAAGRGAQPVAGTVGLVLIAGTALLLASSSATAPTSIGLILRTAVLGILYTLCFPLASLGAEAASVGRGAINAAIQGASGLANAIGPLAAGKIGETLGDSVAYLIVAGLCLAAAGWTLVLGRRQAAILAR